MLHLPKNSSHKNCAWMARRCKAAPSPAAAPAAGVRIKPAERLSDGNCTMHAAAAHCSSVWRAAAARFLALTRGCLATVLKGKRRPATMAHLVTFSFCFLQPCPTQLVPAITQLQLLVQSHQRLCLLGQVKARIRSLLRNENGTLRSQRPAAAADPTKTMHHELIGAPNAAPDFQKCCAPRRLSCSFAERRKIPKVRHARDRCSS